jgi:arylsulfatase A-like enzyme
MPEHSPRRVGPGAPAGLVATVGLSALARPPDGRGSRVHPYYTHSSPCSPSRASLLTGRYLPGHGVTDNVIMPEHHELDPSVPTVGSLLRDNGYRSSYIGKWHLSQVVHPDMEAYGFSDWDGNDRHFMG